MIICKLIFIPVTLTTCLIVICCMEILISKESKLVIFCKIWSDLLYVVFLGFAVIGVSIGILWINLEVPAELKGFIFYAQV